MTITDPRIFPVIIIVMFIAAGIRYAFAKDWAQCGYWISAAVLNVFILGMAK